MRAHRPQHRNSSVSTSTTPHHTAGGVASIDDGETTTLTTTSTTTTVTTTTSTTLSSLPRRVFGVRATGTTRGRSNHNNNSNSMHSVLQLHYQIQRRSYWEKWVTLCSLACFVIFMTATCLTYRRIVHLEEQRSKLQSHQHNAAPLERLLEQGGSSLKQQAGAGASLKRLRSPSLKFAKMARNPRKLRYHPELEVGPTVREQFLAEHPNLTSSIMAEHIDRLRQADPQTFLNALDKASPFYYDIYNCPTNHVPEHYPYAWKAMDVLRHWNPDITVAIPSSTIHQSLCVFDWHNERHRDAVTVYRNAEVPFVLRHHDDVVATSYRWSSTNYLHTLLHNVSRQRNEHSVNNHFMFWRLPPKKLQQKRADLRQHAQGFVPPTNNVELSYDEWLERAHTLENVTDDAQQVSAEHWYFRLNAGLPKTNTFLYDELPMFQPTFDRNESEDDDVIDSTALSASKSNSSSSTSTSTLFMVDSSQQRGINCRFGMRGVIAEAHFDPTRNWIMVLNGQRRYILAHPQQCRNLELYPKGHPSGRHSSINWSTIAKSNSTGTSTATTAYTGPFAQAMVQEVVLQGGDALYLPTSWFHFIVSLSTNYQCNARSGETLESRETIKQCGFDLADKQYHGQQPPMPR